MISLQILQVYCAKGKTHDFKMLKDCRVAIAKHIEKLADSGYQGIAKLYSNTQIPFKKPKGGKLSEDQKKHNQELAKRRIAIEHVNRRCKIFRIVKETYRGKHKNYGRIWNLVAALVNFRYSESVTV
jgi:IS5 family transposase